MLKRQLSIWSCIYSDWIKKMISIYRADSNSFVELLLWTITVLYEYINDYELIAWEVLFWGLTHSRAYKQSVTF